VNSFRRWAVTARRQQLRLQHRGCWFKPTPGVGIGRRSRGRRRPGRVRVVGRRVRPTPDDSRRGHRRGAPGRSPTTTTPVTTLRRRAPPRSTIETSPQTPSTESLIRLRGLCYLRRDRLWIFGAISVGWPDNYADPERSGAVTRSGAPSDHYEVAHGMIGSHAGVERAEPRGRRQA
jgi:hypothetical protein